MRKITPRVRAPSSFRDPSGFLFTEKGILFRQINKIYRKHYDRLMKSGLYENLVKKGLLISHSEDNKLSKSKDGYKIIKPELVSFISYPYEWCFGQLKDTALLTLKIQKTALNFGMTLKDASAYNIQFVGGKPVFIDTLSFEIYEEGEPWVAYRQFCQHFLSPLVLMSHSDIRLSQLLRVYIDGIPLDLTSKLLSFRSYFNPLILSHIHLHARVQKTFENKGSVVKKGNRKYTMSLNSLTSIIVSLESLIKKLKISENESSWSKYYDDTIYSKASFSQKENIVKRYLKKSKSNIIWDLGSNTGHFSRIASKMCCLVLSFDSDLSAVEQNYKTLKKDKIKNIYPLVIDFTNPSSSIGWANEERKSLMSRGPADCLLALALIHHLAITNNVPFAKLAEFFSKIGKYLIVEFISKRDPNVQKLLLLQKDVYKNYTKISFENDFGEYFEIISSEKIRDTSRYIYLMKKR
jgi:ribosomal protein L11 methylase PrmA